MSTLSSDTASLPLRLLGIPLFRFAILGSLVTILYHAGCYAYNIFWHPLRKYPGPKLWAASRIPHEWSFCRGNIHTVLRDLHERYGEVVRIGPNNLSFVHPDAWNDIYSRQKHQSQPFPRDPLRYTEDLWIDGAPDVWTSPDEVHPRLRRALSPLFSDRALKSYLPIVMQHLDHFTTRLEQMSDGQCAKEDGQDGSKIDFSTWLSFLLYDIVGDLAFGEPFGCVESGKFHPWLARIVESARAVVIVGAIRQFPWISALLERIIRPLIDQALKEQQKLTIDKVDRRLSEHKDRSDFIDVLLAGEGQRDGLTRPELYSNALFLILAGSETSATVLSGTLYHLVANPQAFSEVISEVRNKFATKEIDFESMRDLPVLTAAIDESMRMYPGALYSPKLVPQGGASICGSFVPEGTSVGIYQSVAYRFEANFRNPSTYDPRRFLDDPKYATDRKDAFRPFSVGAKNCVGYKLAYFQIKLILVNLILNFDLQLCPESALWTNHKVFLLPDRPPLMMRIHRVGK